MTHSCVSSGVETDSIGKGGGKVGGHICCSLTATGTTATRRRLISWRKDSARAAATSRLSRFAMARCRCPRAMFTCTTRSAQSWHLPIFLPLFENFLSGRKISAPARCVHTLQSLTMLSPRPPSGTSSVGSLTDCCSTIDWHY